MQHMINNLNKLEDECEKAKKKLFKHQALVRRWFDKKVVGNKDFWVGNLVQKWDEDNETKGKQTKFHKLWLVPFQIHQQIGP